MPSLRTRWMLRRLIDAYQIHDTLPVPIEAIARRMGWTIEYHECMASLYGFITLEGGRRCIVVNGSLSRPWLRATVAHELGHWIAGHLHEGGRVFSYVGAPPDDPEEREATAVAALLLVPPRAVRRHADPAALAQACGVPRELVDVRLDLERRERAAAAPRGHPFLDRLLRWFGLPLEGIH